MFASQQNYFYHSISTVTEPRVYRMTTLANHTDL